MAGRPISTHLTSTWRSPDMYRSLYWLFSIAIPVLGFAQAARADEASDMAVYVVSYIEVMPSSQGEAAALLKQYRDASRKDAGNMRLEVLQQSGRPDHFARVEMWQHQKVFEAQGTAAHTAQLRDKPQPMRVSPQDERVHKGPAVSPPRPPPAAGATYVVTHADAVPPAKDD